MLASGLLLLSDEVLLLMDAAELLSDEVLLLMDETELLDVSAGSVSSSAQADSPSDRIKIRNMRLRFFMIPPALGHVRHRSI